MPYIVEDFFTLRTAILNNSILSQLLAGIVSHTKTPIIVGKSLIWLKGVYRGIIKKEKGKNGKLPNYIMADVRVQLIDGIKIGYSYQDYPIFWEKHLSEQDKLNVSTLKKIVKAISSQYKINASKADKIFSLLPESLVNLLETNNFSKNFWKNGFSKPIKQPPCNLIDEQELDKYYKLLATRLDDWRHFNSILISLAKKGYFEIENPKFGKILASSHPIDKNMVCFSFISYLDNTRSSAYINCFDLTPLRWEILNPDIDIFTLRKVFTS